MGDGNTIEMMSSTKNCVKQKLQKARWAYYGIPNWLETKTSTPAPVKKDEVIVNIQKWCNNYCNAKITVSGKFDSNTKKALCKALQHCLNLKYKANLKEDGSFGPKTKAKCKNATASSALIYICQAMLYCKGYDMKHSIKGNNLDSSYGKGTKAADMPNQINGKVKDERSKKLIELNDINEKWAKKNMESIIF